MLSGWTRVAVPVVTIVTFVVLGARSSSSGPDDITRAKYAAMCSALPGNGEKMGDIPDFNCMDGKVIPITVNGVAVTKPVDVCDKPVQLGLDGDGQCVPFSRLQKLNTGNPHTTAYVICRKYHASTADDPTFNDIALIEHHNISGVTCFFQSPVDGTPIDGTHVPSPMSASATAADWLEPAINTDGTSDGPGAPITCTRCHAAGPFIQSPYIRQAHSFSGDGDSSGQYRPTFDWVRPADGTGAWQAKHFRPTSFEPDRNACAECHRIGAADAFIFVERFGVGDKSHTAHPSQIWMPPGFRETTNEFVNASPAPGGNDPEAADAKAKTDEWNKRYAAAMDQLRKCNGALVAQQTTPPECNAVIHEMPVAP